MANPVEEYLVELRLLRRSRTATKELSLYKPLIDLLNSVGSQLKPRVRCIAHPADIGAGFPDIGLYTSDQLPSGKAENVSILENPPSRGVVEAKPTSSEVRQILQTKQVADYLERYRSVLVTNYRDFLLVAISPEGQQKTLESYQLAQSEETFWAETVHARRMADQHGRALVSFLERVLLFRADLIEPKDVASFLASYALQARELIGDKDLSTLKNLRGVLEEVLGISIEDKGGEHFFRSTLIQSLFYGIFAAWVSWARRQSLSSREKFDWRLAQHELRVPALVKLVNELTNPNQIRALGLPEILDWTGEMFNRVQREPFFERFEEHHAVQYFYEPFLQAYDPELRDQLGVWYTPREIVQYMVERVDHVLRTELDVADGLADKDVLVLDPCCGTGAYLV
jgi:hypothetical protein